MFFLATPEALKILRSILNSFDTNSGSMLPGHELPPDEVLHAAIYCAYYSLCREERRDDYARRNARDGRRYDHGEKDQIVIAYNHGISYDTLAKAHFRRPKTIRRIIRRHHRAGDLHRRPENYPGGEAVAARYLVAVI